MTQKRAKKCRKPSPLIIQGKQDAWIHWDETEDPGVIFNTECERYLKFPSSELRSIARWLIRAASYLDSRKGDKCRSKA
jgi:hypothetical protein